MTETTTPIICDEHYFVPAEVDETYETDDVHGRIYEVVRLICPVANCGAAHEEGALLR